MAIVSLFVKHFGFILEFFFHKCKPYNADILWKPFAHTDLQSLPRRRTRRRRKKNRGQHIPCEFARSLLHENRTKEPLRDHSTLSTVRELALP